MKQPYDVKKPDDIVNLSHNEAVLVSSIAELGEPYGLEIAERAEEVGGRPKRFFRVTGAGASALAAAKDRSRRLVEVWGV
jgi:hypothetical protein